MRPRLSPSGISWWRMPLPAVIPLYIAGTRRPLVAEAVLVLDRTGEHIGDGLDAAVRVPREPRTVVVGTVIAKVVK